MAGILCGTLLVYLYSYGLATRRFQATTEISRVFTARWKIGVFTPAAAIEAKIRGMDVVLSLEEPKDQNGVINVRSVRRLSH
jgi:hypothetical protein